MSQTTLLSFFNVVNNARGKDSGASSAFHNDKDEIRCEDSPVKSGIKIRKRNRISSSSSESNHSSDELQVEQKDKSISKKRCLGVTEDINKVEDVKKESSSSEDGVCKENILKENADSHDGGETNKSSDKGNGDVSAAAKDKDKNKGSYNPNVANYDPVENATWGQGEKVPYFALARTLEEIENTSARLKVMEILSNYLQSVIALSPEDLLPSICLCLNVFGPPAAGKELGIADSTLVRAISQSTSRSVTQIRRQIQELGDIGSLAEKSRSSQKLMVQSTPLTVSQIFKKFSEMCDISGPSTVNKKITIIQNLFVACKGPEAKFLFRSLNGKLRIGVADQTVLQALARACAKTPPEQEFPRKILDSSKSKSAESFKAEVAELAAILKRTYCECPNYNLIIPTLIREGIRALPDHCQITPGLPMKPMLAEPTRGVKEVFARFENVDFTCEWKYDGERAQIHRTEDGVLKIFSRNQEDNTSKYPDIVSRMDRVKKENVTSFILDCEAVAWDSENKKILPFQVLSKRKRKDATLNNIEVQVCLFMFDLLYLNGKPLIRESLYERRRLLRENFVAVEGESMFAKSIDSSKIEEVNEFLEESVKGTCEGLMVKTLKEEATYEISKRSRNWLKLKKDYLEGVGDTMDVVVLGGYFGKGKRAGTYGGFLVGCYDDDSEEYQSVCKLGVGFTDDFLSSTTEALKEHVIPKPPSYYQYDSSLEPDHWFAPAHVWEIKCADLSLSPIHRAGIGSVDPTKGISLRFPRFLRIRDDKKSEEGTTAKQIIDMYNNQEQVKSLQESKPKFAEEDFY